MLRTMLLLALMISLPVLAQQGRGGRAGGQQGNPACAPIRQACEKAGYKRPSGGRGGPGGAAQPGRGGDDSPGTIRECMQKWNNGEKIAGLNVKPSDASAKECSAHMARMKERGAARRGRGGAGAGAGSQRTGPGRPNGPGPGGVGRPPLGGAARPTPPTGKPSPLAPSNPNPAAPAVLPPVPSNPPPKKP